MDLKARVTYIVNGKTDGRKTGRLCRTLLKQVRQKCAQGLRGSRLQDGFKSVRKTDRHTDGQRGYIIPHHQSVAEYFSLETERFANNMGIFLICRS